METDQLVLREWQTKHNVPLSPAQRDLLLGSPITLRPSPGSDQEYDLTPGSEIGTIELPDLTVRILPKLDIERVLFLVSYALDGLKLRAETSDFEKRPDLLEAIVSVFTAELRQTLRPGLLQGYRSEEDALMTVRGRIQFEQQIRRFGIIPPIDVRFDEFTVDIEENRLIKAAIERLSRMRLRADRSRRELRAVAAPLRQVASIEYGGRIPQITFTRLNERYRSAIRLAELILKSTTFDLGVGVVSAPSFLIDMNRVFEDFVVRGLREALRLTTSQFPQEMKGRRLTLDTGDRIKLEPDLSWWEGNRCVFVGDVKYKKTIDMRVPNADIYQVHAYVTATGLRRGTLIYAHGEDDPALHQIRQSGLELEVVALDLSAPPASLLAEIGRLADRIRSDASQSRERLSA